VDCIALHLGNVPSGQRQVVFVDVSLRHGERLIPGDLSTSKENERQEQAGKTHEI
jgi:hypothetical protein